MALLAGTPDGVYRSGDGTFEDVELVLDAGSTLRVHTVDGDDSYAATKTGLYRSRDGGRSWTDLGVPRNQVDSVALDPGGDRLYAGTYPADVYVSTDDGGTWSELEGFRALPSRDRWGTPRHGNEAHVRSLETHPDAPGRVVAGVEVGGVHVSDDAGRTWTERRDGLEARSDSLQYDVHHIHVSGADEWVVSCGGGLYRTGDAGRTWIRLADDRRPYFQASIAYDGRLYAAAQTLPPTLPFGPGNTERDVDAVLLESTDRGSSFESVPYPGEPDEYVSAWTVLDGRVLGGTTGGRVVVREHDGWSTRGFVPAWIRALAVG